MRQDVKKIWVEALRSGKYKQARVQLRDGDAFCCLGVLCDISGAKWRGLVPRSPNGTMMSLSRDGLSLSDATLKAAGLSEENEEDLVHLNDEKRRSFSEIADWIEANL